MKRLLLPILLLISSALSGTTYYVSTSGSNSNNGLTQSTAWQTLQWAESHATAAGDIIALKMGDNWATNLALGITHGGATGNPIVWDGGLWGSGSKAIISATGNRPDGQVALISIAGCKNVTVQNITVDGKGYDCEGIVIGGGSDKVYGPNAVQNDEKYITVQDCSIINIGSASTEYALAMIIQTWNNDMSDITIRRNNINGSSNWGIAGYQGRALYGATPATQHNIYIGYNTITRCGLNGDGRGAGIGLTQMVKGAIVEHNLITQGTGGKVMGMTQAGEDGQIPTGIIWRYNDVRMENEPCFVIGNGGPQTADVYCNKFCLNNASGKGTIMIYPADVPYTGGKLNFWNNTVVAVTGGGFDNGTGVSGVTTFVNNLLVDNSNSVDPLFINKATFDYHLQSGSPYIGKGVAVSVVPADFDGKAFKNPPSLGAYEYGSTGTAEVVYMSSVVENATPSVLDLTYSNTLANIVPAISSFTVLVNSVARSLNSAVITGNKVRLTMADKIVYGDVVTVSYTRPATNPLQTESGVQAATISDKTVVNNLIPSIPVYSGSAIKNTAPNILEMTYSLSLANVVPATSAFSVSVNSVARSVNSVTVSGTKVLLTLSIPVVYGDIVTVSYAKPASNPLQTASGEQAAAFSAKAVTNEVSSPIPAYMSSTIQNASPSTLEMTYNLALATVVPASTAFSVRVNSITRTVNVVSVSGTKVSLTLATPVVSSDAVTVSYTKPVTNPIQSASGGQAATLSAQTVVNNVTTILPAYVSSAIQNASSNVLEITFNLSLAAVVPASSAFSVRVNSVVRTVQTVSVSGTKVLLTLASPVVSNDAVTVSYTKPATNPLQTVPGGQAATFSTQIVTNNVSNVIPVYVSSAIQNATPNILEITYNLSLASLIPASSAFAVRVNSVARTVSAVAISGTKVLLTLSSPVANGNVVTLSYTKPITNPLQISSGGQAATISAQAVTNNVIPAGPPVYVSSAIENASPNILEMTYNLSLATIVPGTSAFTVTVNSLARTVSTITINGTKVRLTLANPVVYGNIVTVAYTKPASNPLQTTSGGQAATLSAQTVISNVSNPATLGYISSVILNTNPALLELNYNLTLADIKPAVAAFNVLVNSVARNVNSITISGTKVILTLTSAVTYGDVITVSYTKPATNPLQSSSGLQASTMSARTVINNVNPTGPVYISSIIENTTPGILEITYNSSLATIVPAVSAFTVTVNSEVRSVNSVSISGPKVLLTLSSQVTYGDIVNVGYTKPATNPLQSSSGGVAANLSARPVTNTVKVDPVNPVYISSSIENLTPSTLEITYSEILDLMAPDVSAFIVAVNGDNREVISVSISGSKVLLTLASPVVSGDVITVSYTRPPTNQLKKATGEIAASFSFPQPVTNNLAANTLKRGNIIIYPNPATESINISQLEASPEIKTIRIYDFSGKLCLETRLDPYVTYIKIPISLRSGSYLLQIATDSVILFIQKLIVKNY